MRDGYDVECQWTDEKTGGRPNRLQWPLEEGLAPSRHVNVLHQQKEGVRAAGAPTALIGPKREARLSVYGCSFISLLSPLRWIVAYMGDFERQLMTDVVAKADGPSPWSSPPIQRQLKPSPLPLCSSRSLCRIGQLKSPRYYRSSLPSAQPCWNSTPPKGIIHIIDCGERSRGTNGPSCSVSTTLSRTPGDCLGAWGIPFTAAPGNRITLSGMPSRDTSSCRPIPLWSSG